jgi:hypothetical protein
MTPRPPDSHPATLPLTFAQIWAVPLSQGRDARPPELRVGLGQAGTPSIDRHNAPRPQTGPSRYHERGRTAAGGVRKRTHTEAGKGGHDARPGDGHIASDGATAGEGLAV